MPQQITGAAKVAGVIGNPISHSMSPALHQYWLKKHEIDGLYVPFCVPSEPLLEMTLRTLAMRSR